jgi:hypothetical protein
MAFTPIPIGSLAWGAPVNSALAGQDTRITALEAGAAGDTANAPGPADQGWITWNYDPVHAQSGVAVTSGTVYMMKIHLREAATVSSVSAVVSTGGTGLTAGQCFAGLYDSTGTQLAVTADQSGNWANVAHHMMTLTAPVNAAAGAYYIALLANGTTGPAFIRSGSPYTIAMNANTTLTTARWTTGPTAQTSLPASITLGSRAFTSNSYWGAVA